MVAQHKKMGLKRYYVTGLETIVRELLEGLKRPLIGKCLIELRDVTEHEFNQWILDYSRNKYRSGVRYRQENCLSKC